MQAGGVFACTLLGIHVPEPAGIRVVVAGAQVVEAQVRVVLFAREEVIVGRGARAGDQVSESVVVVGVGDPAQGVGQVARAVVAVVTKEEGLVGGG